MLNTLNNKHGVQPHERSNEGEQGAVEASKALGRQFGSKSLLHAGKIFRPQALTNKEDDGYEGSDEETPLEQRIDRVEHAVGSHEPPHERVGIQGSTVVGASKPAWLVGRTQTLDIVEDEILRRDGHETRNDDGANLTAEHGPRRNLAVVSHLLILDVVVSVAGERPAPQRLAKQEGIGIVGQQEARDDLDQRPQAQVCARRGGQE